MVWKTAALFGNKGEAHERRRRRGKGVSRRTRPEPPEVFPPYSASFFCLFITAHAEKTGCASCARCACLVFFSSFCG